jgi:hypothetical protein
MAKNEMKSVARNKKAAAIMKSAKEIISVSWRNGVMKAGSYGNQCQLASAQQSWRSLENVIEGNNGSSRNQYSME